VYDVYVCYPQEAKTKHQQHLSDAERTLRIIRKEVSRAQRQQPQIPDDSDSDLGEEAGESLVLPLKPRSCVGTEVITTDFQANLMTPKLSVGESFYMRKLKTYNYGIWAATRGKHTMVFWDEKTGHKVNSCSLVHPTGHTHHNT
jgi:hypothetical protein